MVMNKQNLISQLKEKSQKLAELTENISRSSFMKVDGQLVCKKQKGKMRLFKRAEDSKEKYLKQSDRKLIKELSEKTYLQKLDKAAQREKMQIDKCIEVLESKQNKAGRDLADVDKVYDMLPDYVKENVEPAEISDEAYARKWQSKKYNRRWMKNDEKYYETPRGDKVRSKSEWIIASMLENAGVPYRYEEIVPLDGRVGVFMHPDFTVLNKRTRQVYYWEHCGMMGERDYMENSFMPKMSEYYNFEFFPGDKILLTFESKDHPLDTVDVKRLIDKYLI